MAGSASNPPKQNSQTNTVARPANGQLVSGAVANAKSGFADALEESAKARIQYGQ